MNRRVLVSVEADEAPLALLFRLGKGLENSIERVNQFGAVVVDNIVNLPRHRDGRFGAARETALACPSRRPVCGHA